MKFTMRSGRRKNKPESKPWPPPYANLPPPDILLALDRGDERPYLAWQKRQGGKPSPVQPTLVRKLKLAAGGPYRSPADATK